LRRYLGGAYQAADVSGTIAYDASKELAIKVSGTTFSLFYDGVQIGADATINDAAYTGKTEHGIYGNATANASTNDFVAWDISEPATIIKEKRPVRIKREDANNLLVMVPVTAEANRIVAEFRLKRITTVIGGWGFASNCWHLLGLRIVDLDGVASPKALTDIGGSSWEYSFTIGADADIEGDYGLYGSIHQAQAISGSASIRLDNKDLSDLPIGVWIYGKRLLATQTIDTYYPKDKTTVIGSTVLSHIFTTTFVEAVFAMTHVAGYKLYASYAGMLPTSNADSAGCDTYKVGSNAAAARVFDDGAKNINTQTDTFLAWHSTAHSYRVKLFLPSGGPDADGNWTYAGSHKGWFQDRAPNPAGVGKHYVNYVGSTFATDKITAASSSHRARWSVEKV
jgi:hypothetical protein